MLRGRVEAEEKDAGDDRRDAQAAQVDPFQERRPPRVCKAAVHVKDVRVEPAEHRHEHKEPVDDLHMDAQHGVGQHQRPKVNVGQEGARKVGQAADRMRALPVGQSQRGRPSPVQRTVRPDAPEAERGHRGSQDKVGDLADGKVAQEAHIPVVLLDKAVNVGEAPGAPRPRGVSDAVQRLSVDQNGKEPGPANGNQDEQPDKPDRSPLQT